MPEHSLKLVEVPEFELSRKDLKIAVYADEVILGHLTVSRGGVGWYPSRGQQERHLNWEQFDRLVRSHFGESP